MRNRNVLHTGSLVLSSCPEVRPRVTIHMRRVQLNGCRTQLRGTTLYTCIYRAVDRVRALLRPRALDRLSNRVDLGAFPTRRASPLARRPSVPWRPSTAHAVWLRDPTDQVLGTSDGEDEIGPPMPPSMQAPVAETEAATPPPSDDEAEIGPPMPPYKVNH